MLAGAALGALMVLWGTTWQGERAPGDPLGRGTLSAVGAGAGAAVSLTLYLLRAYRRRGALQHYCAWAVAGVVGVLVIVLPDLPEAGWRTALFALWGGAFAGLGCGATEAYWRGRDE